MNSPLDPLPLLISLIRHPSVSVVSNTAITDAVSDTLAQLGFEICRCDYTDDSGVRKANLVATRMPVSQDGRAIDASSYPGVAYFAHTDVVPVRLIRPLSMAAFMAGEAAI
jgi:acetylornithine deacetylase/succinyl-diaminopimelate desuccinylase-like protein